MFIDSQITLEEPYWLAVGSPPEHQAYKLVSEILIELTQVRVKPITVRKYMTFCDLHSISL